MANILIYNTEDGSLIKYIKSVNTPDFEGRPDVLINPDVLIINSVDKKYLKVDNGIIVEMTQAEKDAVDTEIQAQEESAEEQNIQNMNITLKEAFIAWLNQYNSKVPVQYRVTPTDLLQQVRDNRND